MPPWLWLILLFLAVCVLALFGIKGDDSWRSFVTSRTFADDLYGIIQLFVLEGRVLQPFGNDAPWPLRAAAFAAPVITIFAFLQLVWTEVSNGVSTAFYRLIYRNHVVVLGMGARGRTFVLDALAEGKRVVAIDTDASAAAQVPAKFRKFRFVNTDVFNPHLIARYGLARSCAVVIFCGSGFTNLSVAQHVSTQIGALRKKPDTWPRIICDATGSAQRDQVEQDQLYYGTLKPQIEFYSPEDVAARLLITTHAPAQFAALFRRPRMHIVVFGDGPLAEAVVRQSAVLTQQAEGEGPRISLVANSAPHRGAQLHDMADALAPVATLNFIDADALTNRFWSDEFSGLSATASQYVVCLDGPGESLELALRLHRETHAINDANVPIFIGPLGMKHATTSTIEAAQQLSSRLFANNLLTSFGERPNVLGWRYVIDQQQDELARRNHANYLAQVSAEVKTNAAIARPAALPWVKLPERFRFSNRSFVDHLPAKLARINHVIVRTGGTARFSAQAVEILARDEHKRWWAERLSMGWRCAEVRDDRQRLHPDLIEWEQLPDATREYDIALVRKIPELLAKVQQVPRQVCRIGVSGHRDTSISRSNSSLVVAIETELKAIRQANPGSHFQIWSPLAEGADRLVAELAIDILSASLHVILPLPIDQYCEDFISPSGVTDALSVRQFQILLNRAEQVLELPIMPEDEGGASHRQWQYASAGAFLLQRCDEMIFIWDGQPANGFGGTGQVVEWQKTGHIPESLRWPELMGEGLASSHMVAFTGDERQ